VKARFPLGGTQHRVGAEGVLRDEGFNSESPCIAKLLIAVTVRRFYTASVDSGQTVDLSQWQHWPYVCSSADRQLS